WIPRRGRSGCALSSWAHLSRMEEGEREASASRRRGVDRELARRLGSQTARCLEVGGGLLAATGPAVGDDLECPHDAAQLDGEVHVAALARELGARDQRMRHQIAQ